MYDRLFTDETPDAHKDKNFLDFINPDSLQIIYGFCGTKFGQCENWGYFQFQRMGYFNIDTDSNPEKLVFNRTVGLRDTWAKIQEKN